MGEGGGKVQTDICLLELAVSAPLRRATCSKARQSTGSIFAGENACGNSDSLAIATRHRQLLIVSANYNTELESWFALPIRLPDYSCILNAPKS